MTEAFATCCFEDASLSVPCLTQVLGSFQETDSAEVKNDESMWMRLTWLDHEATLSSAQEPPDRGVRATTRSPVS